MKICVNSTPSSQMGDQTSQPRSHGKFVSCVWFPASDQQQSSRSASPRIVEMTSLLAYTRRSQLLAPDILRPCQEVAECPVPSHRESAAVPALLRSHERVVLTMGGLTSLTSLFKGAEMLDRNTEFYHLACSPTAEVDSNRKQTRCG